MKDDICRAWLPWLDSDVPAGCTTPAEVAEYELRLGCARLGAAVPALQCLPEMEEDYILDGNVIRGGNTGLLYGVYACLEALAAGEAMPAGVQRPFYPLRMLDCWDKFMTTLMVLTMYVNAGLIPNYLLISKTLHLSKSYWVYIIPTMFSCFNMIVMRTYIAGLPEALVESARIDGAGDFRIFWQIIFPLCKPVLATVALFVAVGSWNSWLTPICIAAARSTCTACNTCSR